MISCRMSPILPVSLALVCLAFSCSNKKTPAESEPAPLPVAVESAVSIDAATPAVPEAEAPKTPLPPIVEVSGPVTMLAKGSIWTPRGATFEEVTPSYFYFKPEIGAEVSIHPLCDRPTFRLQIVEIVEQELDEVIRWEATLSPLPGPIEKDGSAEADECQVVSLYPAQSTAKIVDHTKLKKKQLPKRITAAHVQVAVDTDDDGKPDVLRVEYCTDDRKRVECYEATASALYRRGRKAWKLIYTWEPMS